jgi:hypothetical protein
MVTGETRRAARAALAASLLAVASCELASTTIPRADPQLVVHSILYPGNLTQYVLVEESLTGAVTVVDSGPYDPSNPIRSGNGVPVSGAIVRITSPEGVVLTGTESRRDGRGTGVYEVRPVFPPGFQGGKRYQLSVSAGGRTVTGSTVIPIANLSFTEPTVSFNRDRQSVSLPIKDVSLARAFWVRVEAPIFPYSLFTLDQTISIDGDARNFFTEELIHLFHPGFLQAITVAAVDSNVYDYYRSGNDPFTGTGLINNLTGGIGLFGSAVVVERRVLDVTQDPTGDPIEGRFTRRGGPTPNPSRVNEVTLYLSARGNQGTPDQITGLYLRGTDNPPLRSAIFGIRDGNVLDLKLLTENSTSQWTTNFVGVARGDSLIGSFQGQGGSVIFVRAGK